MHVRVELHILCHAFAKDQKDPERKGIHESLLGKYYELYFKKKFNAAAYAKETDAAVLRYLHDTVRCSAQIEELLTESRLRKIIDIHVIVLNEHKRSTIWRRLVTAGQRR